MFTLNQLAIFKRVVETGSFNKAATEEFITTNAVMKQINKLEDELNAQLLVRSHKGVDLTEAGVVFYEDTLRILSACESAGTRAQHAADSSFSPVRIGTSFSNPPEDIEKILTQLLKCHPNIQVEMVPFENTPSAIAETYANLGRHIDIVTSSFDELIKEYWGIGALELSQIPFFIVLSKTHRLANKEIITFEDIEGESLLLIRRGYSRCIDEIREHIEANYPNIEIVDVPAFGMELYNKAINDQCLVIGIGENIKGHPLTKRIPLDWDKKSPFGILHSATPSKSVKNFLSAVKKVLNV